MRCRLISGFVWFPQPSSLPLSLVDFVDLPSLPLITSLLLVLLIQVAILPPTAEFKPKTVKPVNLFSGAGIVAQLGNRVDRRPSGILFKFRTKNLKEVFLLIFLESVWHIIVKGGVDRIISPPGLWVAKHIQGLCYAGKVVIALLDLLTSRLPFAH